MVFCSLVVALALVPQPKDVELLGGEHVSSIAEIDRAVAAFGRDDALPDEAYRFVVAATGVNVWASSSAGAFYAGVTLRQLMDDKGRLPNVRIADAPKFPWRGIMLDESRHFFGKAAVLRFLDIMARFKLNVLHWHLTDDQGWRIPIPGYPALTETMRPVENRLNFCDLSATGTYGPHSYAKDDLLEIVRYARARHIRIMPEVEIPGHSKALLMACPQFACALADRKVDNAVCVGKDETLRFFERAIDEVCSIFPDAVVHIGGDECNRSDWARCPDCQARMRKEGIGDVAGLQAWVTARFDRYLRAKGRRLMGWDEIAEGGLPPGAMVMSWRGTSTGILAAKGGQDVVMTPNEYCYFDYEQCLTDDPVRYPYNWTVMLPLAKVYSFDPLRGIPSEYHRHVLGAQGNNWSEMTRTEGELQWKVWPRAIALAEVLWSYPKDRDVQAFLKRLEPHRRKLVDEGVGAAPAVLHPAAADGGGVLSHERTRSGERLRYTYKGVESVLTLESGKLTFDSPGRSRSAFKDNNFREIEVVAVNEGVYFATVRRQSSEIVVTVLFDGDCVLIKDRWDERPEPPDVR